MTVRHYPCYQNFPLRVGTTKNHLNSLQKGGGGEELCLQSQEDQDLFESKPAEEHIFNTSREHQTVHLSNKCTTKDFLRDFRYGYTVHGGQEDLTFDMRL